MNQYEFDLKSLKTIKKIANGVFGSVQKVCFGDTTKCYAMKRKIKHDLNKNSREVEALLNLKGCKNVVQIRDIFYTCSKPSHSKGDESRRTDINTSKNDKTIQAKSKTSNVLDNYQLKQHIIYENILLDQVPFTIKDIIVHNNNNKIRLSIVKLNHIIMSMVEGVQAIHEKNLMHRDLKPENILINNTDYEVTISDLGSCKYANQSINNPNCVTLWQRAPELALGFQRYDKRIDLFSVGCIMQEIAMHKPLFKVADECDLLYWHFNVLEWPTQEQIDHLKEQSQLDIHDELIDRCKQLKVEKKLKNRLEEAKQVLQDCQGDQGLDQQNQMRNLLNVDQRKREWGNSLKLS